MSLVSVLHDLVCAEARITPTNGNELHLLETDASASLRKVVLELGKKETKEQETKEQHYACVALDFQVPMGSKKRSSCLSDILNPNSPHPLRAACDALLCIERGDTCHLVHIELKSGDNEKRAIGQLSNSKCFSRFLRELAVQWFEIKPQAYQEWFVLLTSGKKAAAKRRKTSVSKESYAPMEKPSNDPKKPTIFSLQNGDRIHIGKLFQS